MAKRYILVPESSTESVPQQMAEDLLAVSQIPPEALETLVKGLEKEVGFLTSERLAGIVLEALREERLIEPTIRAILHLRRETVSGVLGAIRRWREENAKNAEFFPESAYAALEEKLPRLIQEYPALQRYRKAIRLKSVTGTTVENVELICDVRPVFNKERDMIEGMVPLTTLKLACEGQDEETRVIEVVLSSDMLDRLVDQAAKAQQKLKVIRQAVKGWVSDGLVEPE